MRLKTRLKKINNITNGKHMLASDFVLLNMISKQLEKQHNTKVSHLIDILKELKEDEV